MIRTDGSPADLQILLATTLVIRGINTTEALSLLDRLGDSYPTSRLNAAEALRVSGHFREAADQLRKYLTTADVHRCDRVRFQKVLARMQSHAEESAMSAPVAGNSQAPQ
jgi:hypothetical protein